MVFLRDTIFAMQSTDYKDRFRAEYWQTKIRYEKLKVILNKWNAYNDYKYHIDHCEQDATFVTKHLKDFLGFVPACSYDILKKQLDTMAQLIQILEIRALIEEIDLDDVLLGADIAE